MAASFGQLAAAQSAGVQGPAGTGATVDLNKSGSSTTVAPDVQNSQQLGGSNQSNQQQGAGNEAQNTQQRGAKNQNAQQSGASTSSQDQSSSTGATGDRMNPDSKNKDKAKQKKDRYGSASGGDSSNSGPDKPGTSEQQTGDTQSRQDTPAKPKY
jgi:hypothetical protein